MAVSELMYYGRLGSLFPYDIRHDQRNRAMCDPRSDGSVRLRLYTEPHFSEAMLVFHDGVWGAQPMTLFARTQRFQFWQIDLRPAQARMRYYFALKHRDGDIVYLGASGLTQAVEFHYRLGMDQAAIFETPAWMHGAVLYQIFPERFANGRPELNPLDTDEWGADPHHGRFQGGDLPGIIDRLDYLHDLGVDALYLNPIFASPSNHKYDAMDYYQVDPAFGGNEALRHLVDGLHARGMRLILDASFNHCSPSFFAFRDVREKGPDSAYWNWFTVREYPLKVYVRPHLAPPAPPEKQEQDRRRLLAFQEFTGIPVVIREDDDGPVLEPTYAAWYNVPNMPQFNQTNPETRAYFMDVARFWLREYQIDGWRMDVVPQVVDDFWIDLRRVTKEANPEAYLLAEVWGDTSFWLQGDRFDATMNYNFRFLCLEYFARSRMGTADFLDGYAQMLMMYPDEVNAVLQNLLSSHDAARFLHEAGEGRPRQRLAQLFQMTMPGAPSIYYGDEIGMSGGHDPDCRRAFPWHDPESWDMDTLAQTKALVRLRHDLPALRLGAWQVVWQADEAFAYLRQYDEQRILMVLCRAEGLAELIVPAESDAPELLWGEATVGAAAGGVRIVGLAPWSGLVVRL